MTPDDLKNHVEAALLAAGRPLGIDDLLELFQGSPEAPERTAVRAAIDTLAGELAGRSVEVVEVASGYRIQVRREYSGPISRLWAERPPRYSRALLETLALVAYRQPISRGEIEDVRGVGVSTSIMKTLLEREWIRVVGHREVPGRPALYGTTRQFLDDFGLRKLEDLPPLKELRDLDAITPDLFAEVPVSDGAHAAPGSGDAVEDLGGSAFDTSDADPDPLEETDAGAPSAAADPEADVRETAAADDR